MFDREELNNPHFHDCYFSYDEGLEEALYVFVDGNGFPGVFEKSKTITVAETGYGTGLNLMALLSTVPNGYDGDITFYSVEKYPLERARIIELLGDSYRTIEEVANPLLKLWDSFDITAKGWHTGDLHIKGGTLHLWVYIGDVQEYMRELPKGIDHWFLDGHSPDKNPDMWSPKVLHAVGEQSHEGTTLATFTAAGIVKSALREAGFRIKRRKGFGGKRHMVQGVFQKEDA